MDTTQNSDRLYLAWRLFPQNTQRKLELSLFLVRICRMFRCLEQTGENNDKADKTNHIFSRSEQFQPRYLFPFGWCGLTHIS
jgi:hypothetical protein